MANGRQDTFRILIATDNHLGVWEKDEVRKDDSFRSFEEVLQIAQRQEVDIVLLGGDLFHDNKPSRSTIVRSMHILTKYCLNDKPINFQVLSDQAQNFASGQVNFENPNFNVGLPVFTIHGNHDDPTGASNLSAVDVLSTCSLANYFGKAVLSGSGIGKVRLSPVLMQKGSTKIALYGLGNIRDERLSRMFQTPGCVEWIRPASSEEYPDDEWFNIFVLHQNRVQHSQGGKNSVREGYLARFLDFVVWGHEHQCIAEPWESAESGCHFSVVQPGSSVATALSEGESVKKHVIMLEVCGDKYRTIKFPLETVRPFVYNTISLNDYAELDPEEPEGIPAFLEKKIAELIARASSQAGCGAPMPPLVRLKVDYTGFSTINTQRLGQKFVGQVANPQDIILWQKASARRSKDLIDEVDVDAALLRPEPLEETKIEELITAHLNTTLEILPENELAAALHSFVEKEEKNALSECVHTALTETQAAAMCDAGMAAEDAEVQLSNIVSMKVAQRKARQDVTASLERTAAHVSVSSAPSSSKPSSVLVEDEDDVIIVDNTAKATGRNAKRGAGTSSSKAQAATGGRQQSLLQHFTARTIGPASAASPSLATTRTASAVKASKGRGSVSRVEVRQGATRNTRAAAKASVRQADSDDLSSEEINEDEDAEDGVEADGVEDSEDDSSVVVGLGRKRRGTALNSTSKPPPGGRKSTRRAAAPRKKDVEAASELPGGTAVEGSFVDSDEEQAPPVRSFKRGRLTVRSQSTQNTGQGTRAWGVLK